MTASQGPFPFLTTALALFTVPHRCRHAAPNGRVHFVETESYFGILWGLAAFNSVSTHSTQYLLTNMFPTVGH